MHELVIIGGGSGNSEFILPVAVNEAVNADCVIASKRFLELFDAKKTISIDNNFQIIEKLPELLENEKVAVIVSGDPLLYSLCRTIINKYPEIKIKVIPGISSLQILGCAFGVTMENAQILSIHGRKCTEGKIAYTVSENSEVFFLCSKTNGPREISSALIKYGLESCEICVGENLTYDNQKLIKGNVRDFIDFENPNLCVALVRNNKPEKYYPPVLLPDDAFLRNKSPMTKEEVRAVIISKLRLRPDCIVWDIGAGTGSISVECARFCPFGEVYSIEFKDSALEILEKNKEFFSLENMKIIHARAEDAISHLPEPDVVFIGGSGKSLKKIINFLKSGNKKRIVMSAVTVETQCEAFELFNDMPEFDMIQMSVCGKRKIGEYTVLENNHSITIYSCMTKEDNIK